MEKVHFKPSLKSSTKDPRYPIHFKGIISACIERTFIDFSKAYDCINRNVLFDQMSKYCSCSKTLIAVESLIKMHARVLKFMI